MHRRVLEHSCLLGPGVLHLIKQDLLLLQPTTTALRLSDCENEPPPEPLDRKSVV